MKTLRLIGLLAALVAAPMLWVGSASASERGSAEEAQAMAEAAADYFRTNGAEVAFEAFASAPEFHDRDLYVFAMDHEGTNVAHGTNPALIGRNLSELRDPSGRQFIQEIMNVQDTAWVEYQWQNPETGNVEPKTSYIINVGDYVIGVGAYR